MLRRQTKVIPIGNIKIGGSYPVAIQSMTIRRRKMWRLRWPRFSNWKRQDARSSAVRFRRWRPQALRKIKKQIHIPLVADIHLTTALQLLP